MSVSENIRAKRVEQEMSVEEFAHEMGVVPSTVMRWETDVEPEHKRLNQMAEILDTDITYLLTGNETERSPLFTVSESDLARAKSVNDIIAEPIMAQVAANLKRIRIEHGYTKSVVSKSTGIPMTSLCPYESGNMKRKYIPMSACEELAKFYDMPTVDFVNELLKPIGNGLDRLLDSREELFEYPVNLVFDIFGYEHSGDTIDRNGLHLAMQTLPERERDVLEYRYRNGMTYEEIGEIVGVSRERVRQRIAKSLRKMRHPSRSGYYLKVSRIELDEMRGKNDALQAENERLRAILSLHGISPEMGDIQPKRNLYEIPLAEMEIPVRAYNCLRRAGMKSVGEVSEKSLDELMHLRNMGERSLRELISVMEGTYGVVIH